MIKSGEDPDFTDINPHSVTGMLKLYFRELPEPLCTFKQYNTFCDSQKEKDAETSKSKLEAAVASLPPVNKSLLGSVIRMLKVLFLYFVAACLL